MSDFVDDNFWEPIQPSPYLRLIKIKGELEQFDCREAGAAVSSEVYQHIIAAIRELAIAQSIIQPPYCSAKDEVAGAR